MNRKASVSGTIFDVLNYFLLTVFMFACIYPFYYIFIYSISDPVLAQRGITLLPAGFSLTNYERIFQLKGILNAATVSVLRTVIGTSITVSCCTFFAYLLTKPEMLFRKFIYRYLIITMYFSAGLIPWYLTMKMLHMNNNFLLYVIPGAISAYDIILIKTFIEQLPVALEEAARIDGAGYLKVFAKIIFPLSMPIVATIAVFESVGQWNAWQDNFFLVQNENLKTLQLMLYDFLNQANAIAQQSMLELSRNKTSKIKITPAAIRMTITMIVTLPIIFVYPFMQKYFVKGIMLGAVKG